MISPRNFLFKKLRGAGLVTFTQETINGKLHFCAARTMKYFPAQVSYKFLKTNYHLKSFHDYKRIFVEVSNAHIQIYLYKHEMSIIC